MIRIIAILGVVSLVLIWYAFEGVKRLTQGFTSTRMRRVVRTVYWILCIGILFGFGVAAYIRFSEDQATSVVQWFINAFLTLFVTILVFVLVLLAEDIYRGVATAFHTFRSGSLSKGVPGRRLFFSQIALVLASIPFASFVYGVTKGKYAYKLHKHVLYFDDLPEAFDGFTITQLSDIHAGSFDDAAAVQEGIELVKSLQSDLFVFTGDMVNDHAAEIIPYLKAFGEIKAPFGQFSILGNHDYGMYAEWPNKAAEARNLQQLKEHHATMGYRLLLDEHVALEKGGQKITLLGVENWGKGFIQIGDLDKALRGADEDSFKILLSHDPSHFDEKVKNHQTHIHLTLSGHTHGMQLGIEAPLVRWSPSQYRYKNWAGIAQENNRVLYVNRGFGFIGFSGRVGIWPEITLLELRKKRA